MDKNIYETIKKEKIDRNISIKITPTAKRILKTAAARWNENMSETIGVFYILTEDVDHDTKNSMIAEEGDRAVIVDWIMKLIAKFGIERMVLQRLFKDDGDA